MSKDMQREKLNESVSVGSGQISIQLGVKTLIAVDKTKAGKMIALTV